MSAIRPTKNTGLIVDEFLRYANEHLSTITGTIYTTSNYPPLGQPGPGFIQWQGYSVSGFKESTIIEEELYQEVQIENEIIDDEFIEKGLPLDVSVNNPLLADSIDETSFVEATFAGAEGELPTLPDLSEEEVAEFVDDTDAIFEAALPTNSINPPDPTIKREIYGGLGDGPPLGPMPDIVLDPKKLKEKFMVQTTRVIRELEGGYYHPDMKVKNPTKFKVMGESGETMYGIDRLKGSPATTHPPAARQYWATIDSQNARKNWGHLYIPPPPLRDTLIYLAALVMEPEFNRMMNRKKNNGITNPDLRKVVLSHDPLLFHFIYAAWNGGGWFEGWARIINAAWNGGMTDPRKLTKLMVAKRLDNTGVIGNRSNNGLIAQGGEKIAKILGYA
jgi:hypothetical protein